MKVGDLIMYRPNFQPDMYACWSRPCLVLTQYPPPDDGLWIILIGAVERGVIDTKNYDIEVLNEAG